MIILLLIWLVIFNLEIVIIRDGQKYAIIHSNYAISYAIIKLKYATLNFHFKITNML